MESIADWRTESRTVYSNDFKLRIVELASHADANVAKIARENGVAHNLIFKWLRMWQNEGRVSRRLPGHHRSFMSRKWQRRVNPVDKNTDLQAWEVAVFVHLRDRLKTGDIWVDGSRAWRSFEDYLLPRHVFDQMRAERTATLNAKLKARAKAAAENAIPDAELSDRGLSVSPVREEDSDKITTLSRRLYMLVPHIRITSLLAEVHSWTRFLDCFTHYRTGEQAEDEASLMAAILADATNAGAERMAQSSRGVTIHQMMIMVDRHLRVETYASATSVLVDAQQEHPFAAIWGDGHVSSSDGQFFPAGGRGEASLEYNAKYGKRPGASIYGFLSNRFASFFSRMIQASESEAPWGHISLTGDYLWNEIDSPLERYRPVRTKRFNPKNFTFP